VTLALDLLAQTSVFSAKLLNQLRIAVTSHSRHCRPRRLILCDGFNWKLAHWSLGVVGIDRAFQT
jgi:hypothetical protein